MNGHDDLVLRTLEQAKSALRNGQRRDARRLAENVLRIAPENVDAWLILAAAASPRASLAYLKHALDINPSSQRARMGMHWAIQRARLEKTTKSIPKTQKTVLVKRVGRPSFQKRLIPLFWSLIIVASIGLSLYGFYRISSVAASIGRIVLAYNSQPQETKTQFPEGVEDSTGQVATIFHPTTSTSASSPTTFPSETPTQIPTTTPTLSPTNTATLLPTDTPTRQPTFTQEVAATPQVQTTIRPKKVADNEFWIDVDLSQQRLYAYLGDQLINKFVVSTGLKATPTVTGLFRIYVKYRYASMSGPGYHLEGVPYVMYFFDDYGLHGTYWHNNFGQRMSHGCVNLRTEDAGWIYKHSVVGTIVNIHR